MAHLTRLGLYGGPRQKYGTFSGKVEGVPPGAAFVTRLGLYGGPRSLYATFSGKAAGSTGDGSLGRLSAGLYSPGGKIITLGKMGKP